MSISKQKLKVNIQKVLCSILFFFPLTSSADSVDLTGAKFENIDPDALILNYIKFYKKAGFGYESQTVSKSANFSNSDINFTYTRPDVKVHGKFSIKLIAWIRKSQCKPCEFKGLFLNLNFEDYMDEGEDYRKIRDEIIDKSGSANFELEKELTRFRIEK